MPEAVRPTQFNARKHWHELCIGLFPIARLIGRRNTTAYRVYAMPRPLKLHAAFRSTLFLSALTALVGAAMATPTCAQIFVEQGESLNTRMKQELEEQRGVAERRMRLIVQEMEQVCQLSDQQVRQLRVGIKGIVAKFLAAKAEERKKQWQALGITPTANEDEELGNGANEDSDTETPPGNRVMVGAFGQRYNSYPPVEEFKLWLNTVERVLTSEQLEKYELSVAERETTARLAAVDRFMVNADRKLILTSAQRKQLFELVDNHFGEKLARSERRGMDMMEVNMFMGLVERHNIKMPIDRERVSQILNEDQMEEWKYSFELQLNQLPDH